VTDLAPILQGFFTDRLARQKNASPNTVAAYRDTYRILLSFAREQTKTEPSREDVPSFVELRWRPGDHQAALTVSVWRSAPTGWVTRSSVSRRDRRCMWPLTRRNCLPASTIPAAHQRSAIVPSRQRLTFEL
jgi:hypothetical protein